ncbi:MAG: peptide deformylase [Candidatus Omnitrophica bacterium]|nr:peptide deformylase [Candidatus Omnitrophota bacterium]MCM8826589.1 peptide deformylase [Candidatus Omnitrophota bacterium]
MKKTKLRIHFWGEKILRTKCQQVKEVNDEIRKLLDEMCVLMKNCDGMGLAANQAGLDVSLVVVNSGKEILKLINPKILKREGSTEFEEGCLSFPGLYINIKRASKVWVSYLNERGEPLTIEASGILAVVLQHEIDHINGIVFIDRLPIWVRIRLRKRLKEIKGKYKNGMPE